MRLFVAIACATDEIAASTRGFISEHWQRFFPIEVERYRLAAASEPARSFAMVWSSEPDEPVIARSGRLRVVHTGYARFAGMPPGAFFDKHLRFGPGGPRLDRITGGIAAFAAVQPDTGAVWAWSTQPPVEPLYHAAGDGYRVVSNRPLAAHLIAGRRTRPSLSVAHLPAYLCTGYSLDDDTPFEGVRIVPPHRALVITAQQARLIAHPNPPLQTDPDESLRHIVKRGVAALRDAVSSIPITGSELLLSGGKDSRLLAAAVTGLGRRPLATTFQVGDVEVDVAQEVARRLKLEHRVVPGDFDPTRVRRNIIDNLRRAHGVPNPEAQVQTIKAEVALGEGHTVMFGHHQLQKGSYAAFGPTANTTIEEARLCLYERFANPMVRPEVHEAVVLRRVDDYLDSRIGVNPLELLYWAGHDFRVSRWILGHAHAYAHRWQLIYPLVDETFARCLGSTRISVLRSELLMFALIAKLAPSIRDMPLSKKRWRFESKERAKFFRRGYADRAPPPARLPAPDAPAEAGSFWTGDDTIWAEVRDTVLSSPLLPTFREVVDPGFLDALDAWKPGEAFTGRRNKRLKAAFAWRLFEASLLYGGEPFA